MSTIECSSDVPSGSVTLSIVVPPSPAFYHRPQTIDDIVDHTVVKVLDLLGMHAEGVIERWGGL